MAKFNRCSSRSISTIAVQHTILPWILVRSGIKEPEARGVMLLSKKVIEVGRGLIQAEKKGAALEEVAALVVGIQLTMLVLLQNDPG